MRLHDAAFSDGADFMAHWQTRSNKQKKSTYGLLFSPIVRRLFIHFYGTPSTNTVINLKRKRLFTFQIQYTTHRSVIDGNFDMAKALVNRHAMIM